MNTFNSFKSTLDDTLEYYKKIGSSTEIAEIDERITFFVQILKRCSKRNKKIIFPASIFTDEIIHMFTDLAINPSFLHTNMQTQATAFIVKVFYKRNIFPMEKIIELTPETLDVLISNVKANAEDQSLMKYNSYCIELIGIISKSIPGSTDKIFSELPLEMIRDVIPLYPYAFGFFVKTILNEGRNNLSDEFLCNIIEVLVSHAAGLVGGYSIPIDVETAGPLKRIQYRRTVKNFKGSFKVAAYAIEEAMKSEEIFNHFAETDFFEVFLNAANSRPETCFYSFDLTSKIISFITTQNYNVDFDEIMSMISYGIAKGNYGIANNGLFVLSNFAKLPCFTERVLAVLEANEFTINSACETHDISVLYSIFTLVTSIASISPQLKLLANNNIIDLMVSFLSDDDEAEKSIDFFNTLFDYYSTTEFPSYFTKILAENRDIIDELVSNGSTEEACAKALTLIEKIDSQQED